MKPLVIYHANCADGFGAAFAAWTVLGDKAEYLPMQYGEKLMGVDIASMIGCEVYILDFSFPRKVMDDIFRLAKRVVWLDHHKTAFETWCGEWVKGMAFDDRRSPGDKFITLDDNKSGAVLAWEYFHPGTEAPMLIKHIDDYDRWQFKIDGTKAFNKALWRYAPWSFKQWEEWQRSFKYGDYSKSDEFVCGSDVYYGFIAEGEAILRAHDQSVQSVVKGSARSCALQHGDSDLSLSFGLAANCPPHLTSDVGHELATQSGTYGLCWTLSQTDLVAKCSLRSNGDYDVSAIAKAFGGGGHRNAAGFEVPIATLLGWLK